MPRNSTTAFTLAELLIALAILGVIATFTIPKVLQSQQDGRYKAAAKEAASMVAGAYSAYKAANASGVNTDAADLTPYMNYVQVKTSDAVDESYGKSGTKACTNSDRCLVLHNGGTLVYAVNNHFGSASNSDYLWLMFDPDGTITSASTTNGPGKSLDMTLYFNGRVSLQNFCQEGDTTWYSGTPMDWCPSSPNLVPSWFSWD